LTNILAPVLRMLIKFYTFKLTILSTDSGEYHRMDAARGQTLTMPCNFTQSSEVQWTRNTSYDGYSYVYINGTTRGNHNVLVQFSVVNASTLTLYNVQPADTGLYVCYDTDETGIAAYSVVVEGNPTCFYCSR